MGTEGKGPEGCREQGERGQGGGCKKAREAARGGGESGGRGRWMERRRGGEAKITETEILLGDRDYDECVPRLPLTCRDAS